MKAAGAPASGGLLRPAGFEDRSGCDLGLASQAGLRLSEAWLVEASGSAAPASTAKAATARSHPASSTSS